MLTFESNVACFCRFQSVSLVIEFDENGCMDLISIFPHVVTFGVALPFDEVLQHFATPPSPVAAGLFYFVFFFAINQIRGRSGEVWSM
jgi:hypothetical protein